MKVFCLISEASWGLSKGGKCSICNWCLCFWILSTSTDFQLICSRKIVQINLTRNFQILFALFTVLFCHEKNAYSSWMQSWHFWQIFHKILRPLHLLYRLSWTLYLQTFTFNHNSEILNQNFMNFDWKIQQFLSILWKRCAIEIHWIVCSKKKTYKKIHAKWRKLNKIEVFDHLSYYWIGICSMDKNMLFTFK